MIAGRDEPAVRIVREFVAARKSGAREACIVFGAAMAASADAALINATAAPALDYDECDGRTSERGPRSAVLAEGQYLDASGADALRAYLVGYEVWAELLAREPDAYHVKGWHPTAVLGTLAADAAVGASCTVFPTPVVIMRWRSRRAWRADLVANFGT